MSHQSGNVWHIMALCAILVWPVMSAAAEDDDPPEDAPVKFAGRVAESNIDRWVFQERVQLQGNQIGHRIITAVSARAKIDSQLKSTLEELVKACNLNEIQERKLTLAARGDIKQFYDRIEEVRKKFLAVKDHPDGLNQIFPEISPLQQQYGRGLFGEESLFAKALQKTLTEEQQAKYQVVLLDRRKANYRTAIKACLPNLGNTIVLRPEQHESLLKLLLEETQPPLLYGQYDQQVVMLKLSQIPAAKLRAVLDKGQWKQLKPQLLRASGTEDYLAQYGVIAQPNRNSVVIIRSVRTVVPPPNAQQIAPQAP